MVSIKRKWLLLTTGTLLLSLLIVLIPALTVSADEPESSTRGKPATASSWWNNPDNYPPQKAVNGIDSVDDRWASQWDEYWLEVELNGQQTFSRAQLREYRSGSTARVASYQIAYWDSAAGIWKSAYNGTSINGSSSTGTSNTSEVSFPAVTSDKVRLRMWAVSSTNSNYEPSIWTFDLFNGASTTSVTRNRPATASSVWGSNYNAGKAVNGVNNADTDRWASTRDGQFNNYTAWLEVDLQQPCSFNTAVVSACTAFGNRVVAYQLMYWDGASSSWKEASSGGEIGSKTEIYFATVTASKVRLYVTGPTASDGTRNPSIQLFDLYNRVDIPVTWLGLTANGADGVTDTKILTLTFDRNPGGLSAGDITVKGATITQLTGSGTTRDLIISDIEVDNGEEITVSIASPEPFLITPNTMNVAVYKDLTKNISVNKNYEVFVAVEPRLGIFNPAFQIRSKKGSPNVMLILAAYNSDGILLELKNTSCTIGVNQTVKLQATLDPIPNASEYKFYLWDENFAPITAATGFPIIPANFGNNKIIEARSYSIKTSVIGPNVAPNTLAADFTSLGGGFRAGDYLVYKKYDFKDGGCNTIMMIASVLNANTPRTINVCVDSPKNKIGALNITSSTNAQNNDVNVFREFYGDIASVKGVHDVYLVFPDDTNLNIDWFTFSSYNTVYNANGTVAANPETLADKEARFKWWRDDVYGMFIHFGAYAWYGLGEWYMNNSSVPRATYDVGVRQFNPTEFDPELIVSLAKAAGQKYIMFTSRHHEGFSMYDTQIRNFKDYCVMTFGAYKGGDMMYALANECRKQGVKFGCYYTIFEWHDDSQTSYGNTMLAGRKEEYKTRLKGQLRELVEKYGIEVAWFDGQWPSWWTNADGEEFYRYLRTLKPAIIINNRCFKGSWGEKDYGTPEQTITSNGSTDYWESCMTLNNNWGFATNDNNWKTPDTVINNLLLCSSQGGNYLLNIGPDALGRVPVPSQTILAEAGKYVQKYADTIYGTSAGAYQNLSKILCNGKGATQYLHVLDSTGMDYIVLDKLSLPILSARIYGEDTQIMVFPAAGKDILDLTGLKLEKRVVIELAFAGTPTPSTTTKVSIAQGLPNANYTASNVYGSGYEAYRAFDGRDDTRWATSNVTTPWLQVDLGSSKSFNQALINEYAPRVTSFRILYSNGTTAPTETNWTNLTGGVQVAYTGAGVASASQIFNFPTVTARYVRLKIDTSTTEPTIWEFKLFNETGPRIAITSPADGASNLTQPVVVNGFANGLAAGDHVQLMIGGSAISVTPNANGIWSHSVSGITGASFSVLAVIIDSGGNIIDATVASYKLAP